VCHCKVDFRQCQIKATPNFVKSADHPAAV